MANDLQKVKDLLRPRGCSERTINNYLSCLNRIKQYFKGKGLKELKEEDILDYLKINSLIWISLLNLSILIELLLNIII